MEFRKVALVAGLAAMLALGAFVAGGVSQSTTSAQNRSVRQTQENNNEAANPRDLASKADISLQQAEQIALAAYPGTTVTESELEDEGGAVAYEVELSNNLEVKIDAQTGAIVGTESEDD